MPIATGEVSARRIAPAPSRDQNRSKRCRCVMQIGVTITLIAADSVRRCRWTVVGSRRVVAGARSAAERHIVPSVVMELGAAKRSAFCEVVNVGAGFNAIGVRRPARGPRYRSAADPWSGPTRTDTSAPWLVAAAGSTYRRFPVLLCALRTPEIIFPSIGPIPARAPRYPSTSRSLAGMAWRMGAAPPRAAVSVSRPASAAMKVSAGSHWGV